MPRPVAGRSARLLPKRDCAGMRGKMEEGDDSTGPWLWGIKGYPRWVCRKRHVYVHVL